MIRRILFGLPLILLACSTFAPPTATPAPTATASPAASATFTLTPTVTATATTTSTPTATLTPSPLPSATSTPLPSPTPRGYYAHQTAGFDLTYPTGWHVLQEDTDSVVLANRANDLTFLVAHDSVPGTPTFQAEADDFVSSFGASVKLKQTTAAPVLLADGVSAETTQYSGADTKGRQLTLRISRAVAGDRRYLIAVIGLDQSAADNGEVVTQVLASLHLNHDLYGLPRQQTLVVAGFDPSASSLDPAITHGGASGYVGLLFSGLVRLGPQLQILPDLAESWVTGPAGDVYTFTLRANLRFQSGAPLTAESVKYSWERAADPKTKSDTTSIYLGDIVGVKDKLAGKANQISGLTAVDARTLVVRLAGPRPYFLAKLTYPTAFVVDSKNVAGSTDKWMFQPNASGPYELKENLTGKALVFERNLAYHDQARIPYLVYREDLSGTPLAAYQTGDVDVATVGPNDVLRVRSAADPLHAEWQATTTMCTNMLLIDVTHPPTDDPAVRQALALGLDRDTLIQRLAQDVSVRADSILPPGMPGFATDLPRFAFDASAARAALARSKYAGNVPVLVLNEPGRGGQPSAYLTAVAEMWRQNLGLKVQIKQLDPADYDAAARAQHGNVLTYGWCADYPDPENFLDTLFHSGGDFNVSGYSDSEVDTWLELARTAIDVGQRLALYHQVENRLLGDVVVIPWINRLSDVVVKPYVKGFTLTPLETALTFQWSLDYESATK